MRQMCYGFTCKQREGSSSVARGSKGSGRELHRARQPKGHPLLGGLEPRPWRRMDSSGLMPKRKPSIPRRIGLMRVIWHLSFLPFETPPMSWGLSTCLLS
ncbi:hypothetical protein HAX54_036603 [Datura stramonium]|uniref:Uncharacterized protein n=1 Tax=Datura stramonium TaxID=4076 RepID=A0ABS8VIB6_DATST|nr:hypothetical protein [Datura stramonium]